MMVLALLAPANIVHTQRWANALAERGYKVHLLSMHPAPSHVGRVYSPEVTLHRLLCPAPAGYLLNRFTVKQLLREINPDLLHAHYASGYGFLGRLSGCRPYVLSVWGSDVYLFPQRSAAHRRLLTANLKAADRICSTSHAMAQRVLQLCPQLAPRLAITPFGVDPRRFSPQPRVTSRKCTIGTVKTLQSAYGIDTLIRGFALCRQTLLAKNPHQGRLLRLRIVGDGPDRGQLERLSRKLELGDVAAFVGAVGHDQAPHQLNQLDVYVAASRSESFGVAVLEAGACGLPVVVSNVGGLPEVVEHEKTGLIIPPDDPAALSQALLRLIGQPALRRRLGEEGRRSVLRRYQWSENVTQMEQVYASFAARRRAA